MRTLLDYGSDTVTYDVFTKVMGELEQGLPSAKDAGFLGASLDPAECKLVLIPVPWEATTSYGGGTMEGPEAILPASHQLDLEDAAFGKAYRAGIALLPEDKEIRKLNAAARPVAKRVIEAVEHRRDMADIQVLDVVCLDGLQGIDDDFLQLFDIHGVVWLPFRGWPGTGVLIQCSREPQRATCRATTQYCFHRLREGHESRWTRCPPATAETGQCSRPASPR